MTMTTTAEKMQRLLELWGKFDRLYYRVLQPWKLSYNSFLVLEEMLRRPDGVEPAALADQLAIPRQTMTFVLDGFEQEGLLERRPHPGDRRRKRLHLTPDGFRFASAVCGEVNRRELQAMEALSDGEQEQLLALYDKFRLALENAFSDQKPSPEL